MKKKAIIMVADGLPKVFKDKRMIQKIPAIRRNKNSYLRRPNPTTSPSPRPSPRGGSPILLWVRTL